MIEEKRNPFDNHEDNVLYKYQQPPMITARWFHWEIKFAEQVLLVSSVWSSKEINSNFTSTDIVRSNVGMATIYTTAPDKQRIRASASQWQSCLSFFISLIFLHLPHTSFIPHLYFSTCFCFKVILSYFDSIPHKIKTFLYAHAHKIYYWKCSPMAVQLILPIYSLKENDNK